MAKIIGLPDGGEAEFPDDMSDDAIGEVLRKQFPTPAAAPKERTLGQEAGRQLGLTARGIANAVASPVSVGGNVIGKAVNALAGKEVFKPSTDTVDAYLTKLGLPEAETGIEKGTQVIAQSILPAARLERAVAASPVIASGAAGALTNAALAAPGEEGREALYGGLGGAIGAKGGELLGRAGSSLLKPSAEAQNLMNRGVVPTLGQAVDRNTAGGILVGNIEDVMSTSPLHYGQVARQREGVNKQFREAALKEAESGGLTLVPGTVREQIAALRGQAGSAFDDLNKGLGVRFNPKVEGDMLGLASRHNLGSADEREFSKFVADNYSSRFAGAPGKTSLPYGVMDDMRKRAWDKVGETTGSLRQAYHDIASGLDSARTQVMAASGRPLAQTNQNYSRARVLEGAASVRNPNKLAEDQLFSPIDYSKAANKQGVLGTTGDLAHDASILTQSPPSRPRINRNLTAGQVIEGVGAYTSGGLVPLILSMGQAATDNPTVRKYLLGNPEVAKMVTDALRKGGGALGRVATVPQNSEE